MRIRLSAPRLIVLGFAGMVLLGTLLLKLPASGSGISWMEAFFEAVSAVTVTGLQVVTPATDFTPFGQAVLVVLIQVGGLGIMTATTLGAILIGRRLGFRDILNVREELGTIDAPRNILRLVGQIAAVTLAVELAGAAVLAVRFALGGQDLLSATGYGVFHAVSAFCNAGFDIFRQGVSYYAGDWTVNLVFVALILLGGLGFPVLMNLYYYPRIRRLTLNSKLVLVTSAALVAVGIVSVAALEWNNPRTLGGDPPGTRTLEAIFQGVTPRTAGFATVDYTDMRDPTLAVQIALMFIGVAPTSTGGGIKVTTLALVFLVLLAQVRGHEEVSAFGRTIPRALIAEGLALISFSALLVSGAALALMISDDLEVLPALFEVTSAFGTVGLSLETTPELSGFGKVVVALVMFLGRVGPITLVVALSARVRPRQYSYPEEDVAIG